MKNIQLWKEQANASFQNKKKKKKRKYGNDSPARNGNQ